MRIAALVAAFAGCSLAQTPDVKEIMSRVAANQTRSQEKHGQFVYMQHQQVRLYGSPGKLAREEKREYLVAPRKVGFEKSLTRFEGRYRRAENWVTYDRPGFHYRDPDIDGDLIDDLAKDLMDDRDSPHGIARDLFPLTGDRLPHYRFRLEGTGQWRGRSVYRVSFAPAADGQASWKGEALIDVEECQPVRVSTSLAAKVPLVIRTMLGTNVRGLGFAVSYQKFEDGVWFPVSYGGEFEIKALFFYRRVFSVSLTNSDFCRADVTSGITYEMEED